MIVRTAATTPDAMLSGADDLSGSFGFECFSATYWVSVTSPLDEFDMDAKHVGGADPADDVRPVHVEQDARPVGGVEMGIGAGGRD